MPYVSEPAASRRKKPRQSHRPEVEPSLLNTRAMQAKVSVSATTWRRLRLVHADFPRPIVISDKLHLWDVAAVIAFFTGPLRERPAKGGVRGAVEKKSRRSPSRAAA